MTRIGKMTVAGSAVLMVAGGLATTALGGGAHASKSKSVSVQDSYFSVVDQKKDTTVATIDKGDSVTFKWSADNARPHDVSFTKVPDGVSKKNSGEAVPQRKSYKYTPPKTGTYRYVCTIHVDSDSMRGKIIVRKD